MYITALSTVRVCPVCGSTAIVTKSTGEVVCSRCGTVLDELVVDYGVESHADNVIDGHQRRPHAKPCGTARLSTYSILAKLVGRECMAKLLPRISEDLIRRLSSASIHRDPCVHQYLKTVDPELRPPLIEAVLDYKSGHYPLLSSLSSIYGVDKLKLRRAFRRLKRLCLEGSSSLL